MKKRLLALLLSTGLIATTSAGVLAADFSTVPEMTGDTENAAVFQSPPAGEDPDIEAFMEDSSAESNTAENLPDNSISDEASQSEGTSVDDNDLDFTTADSENIPDEDLFYSGSEGSEDLPEEDGFSDNMETEYFGDESSILNSQLSSSGYTEIPEFNIWLADTVRNGLAVNGQKVQDESQVVYNLITQPKVKPVYQELGERILSNKPMLVISSLWKGVIKQEVYDDQKLVYEALLADYLMYSDSVDSKEFDTSQYERANSYLMDIFKEVSSYYTEKGIYNWKPEDIMDLDVNEAQGLFKSVRSISEAVSMVGDTCSNTKELIKLVIKVNAFKNASNERILLIRKAREAGSSNTSFTKACDEILTELGQQTIDLDYLRSKSASMAWKESTKIMIGKLSEKNPILESLKYGSGAMDILFNTSDINSDNLKLSLLYTMDCYFRTALSDASALYATAKDSECAVTLVSCFQGYTTFQIYANNVAKSYISGVTSGGALNNLYADIFYREGVQNAKEWQALCDQQNAMRRSVLEMLAKFYQVYHNLFINDEYVDALEDQVTVTPKPTPAPLVPENYKITVPESKNPVKYEQYINYYDDTFIHTALFEDGTLVVCGKDGLYQEAITDQLSKYQTDIKKIIIKDGITWIGDKFFYGCINLKTVFLSDSVIEIRNYAFANCTSLQEINIPDTLQTIDTYAFEGCVGLESITLPHSLSWLGPNAFSNCTALKTVVFKSGVEIQQGAFENCSSLENVALSDNLTKIEGRAFKNCNSLRELTFPQKLIKIGYEAFKDCTNLKTITFSNTTTCTIYYAAFQNCKSLESITGNVMIDYDAFNGCTNLKTANISATSDDRDYFLDHCIGDRAFKDCINLNEVILNETKSESREWNIGEEAFSGCSSLYSITLPTSLYSLGAKAFYNCVSLQQIVFPCNYAPNLGSEDFKNCKSLESITFLCDDQDLSSKSFLDSSAFEGCVNLKTIYGYGCFDIERVAEEIGVQFICLDPKPDNITSISVNVDKSMVSISWEGYTDDLSGIEFQINDSKDFPEDEHIDYQVYESNLYMCRSDSFTCIKYTIPSYDKFSNSFSYIELYYDIPNPLYIRTRTYAKYKVGIRYSDWSEPQYIFDPGRKLTPTITPSPTATPAPTDTPKPTAVPKPTTAPKPTTIPTPSKAPSPQAPSSKPTMKVNVSSLVLKTRQSSSALKVTGLAPGDFVKSWKSGNTKIVTVTGNPNGTCKLKAGTKSGKTTLTITLNSGLTKKIPVRVQKTTVRTRKITGIPKKLVLKAKKKATIKPRILPLTSTEKITYKSSNKKVATVSAKGVIVAKKKGTATITVKSGKKSVKCKVTVK